MRRRNFIKNISILGGLFILPVDYFGIGFPELIEGVFPFQIGKFKCYSISDGIWPDATLSFLFSGAPEDVLVQKAKEYNLRQTNIKVPLNFMLIETRKEAILVDTGYGNLAKEWNFSAGNLLERLTKLSIDINKITKVILTHQHPDHLGGVSNKNGELLFPNATFYMDKKEYDSLKNISGWAGEKLKDIEPKLEMLKDGERIINGISVQKSYGHTPGHIHLMIKSKGEKILYTSDTFGHEIHFAYPDWSMGHEFSKEIAATARKEVLERAVKDNLTLFSCHLPFPGIGKVKKEGEGYKWIPQT